MSHLYIQQKIKRITHLYKSKTKDILCVFGLILG